MSKNSKVILDGFARLFVVLAIGCVPLSLLSAGCAIHYYDQKSGTEHLWGFGHMKMKAAPPNEGVQAVVKGTETLGLDLAAGQEYYGIGLGWSNVRWIVVSTNASVRLEWPNGNFFNVRVGSKPPFETNQPVISKKEKQP